MSVSKKPLIIIISILLVLATAGGMYAVLSNKPTKTDTATESNPSTPAPVTPPKPTTLSCVESLPNDVLIGQKIMPALFASQVNTLKAPFAETKVGGVIIMDEISASDITAFKQGFAITPNIATDQEGGTVQRYKSAGIMPGATDIASSQTPQQAYTTYLSDAKYLESIGITTNFAPVVDVASAEPNPLPGRMYSSDTKVVSEYAGQFIQATQKANVTPVVKHFPGLGTTTTNTDNGSATTAPLASLKTKDILPYQSLAKYNSDAMISNAIVPDLTNGQPAIWSPEAVALLRSQGYSNSVIYTDSLTANAIPGTISDAALKTWQAGVDVALIVQRKQDVNNIHSILQTTIANAQVALTNGQLDKTKVAESVLRILQRKNVDPCAIAQ